MMMSKRSKSSFISKVSVFFLVIFIPLFYLKAKNKPDVLFIIIEDLSPQRLGTYGNPVCKTPNLNRFANEGIRFDNSFCTGPPCNPSRASVLSGLRPETTGIKGNGDDWTSILEPGSTLPEHFQKNGYKTIGIGKTFHRTLREIYDDSDRWSEVIREKGFPTKEVILGESSEDPRVRPLKGSFRFLYGPSGLKEEEHKDSWLAQQTIQVLSKEHDKPLFLTVGFQSAHLPFTAPDKYFDMYSIEDIGLPENLDISQFSILGYLSNKNIEIPYNPPDDLEDTPLTKNIGGQWGEVGLDKYFKNKKMWREVIIAQYATTSFVDAQIGKILNALRESDREGRTIVVIWSDHGFQLGEHFQWRKSSLFDHTTRVILLMRVPGVTKPGSVCKRLVEATDIYPTLCDLCGIPIPNGLEGISIKPLLNDPNRSWKKAAFVSLKDEARSINTQRWRYTEYSGGELELYDHMKDPGEFTNLAQKPEHSKVVDSLSTLLHAGWKACLPDTLEE
jgi:uncharacterized sulfatase